MSTTLAASRRAESEKNRWICNTWNTKLFSDVNVFCGLDRRVVKTSRLFLCGLSKYLCKVFLDHSSFYSEEIALILPDMDSATLSDFLKNVCSGRNNLAKVDKSLKFLGFGNVAVSETTSFSGHETAENQDSSEDFSSRNETNVYDVSRFGTTTKADEFSFGRQRVLEDVKSEESREKDKSYKALRGKKRTRRKKSLVWKFFKLLKDEQSQCLLCNEVHGCSNGTTSGMLKHLRRVHAEDYAEVMVGRAKKCKTDPKEEVDSRDKLSNVGYSGMADVKAEPMSPVSKSSLHLDVKDESDDDDEGGSAVSSGSNNFYNVDESSFSTDGDLSFERQQQRGDDESSRMNSERHPFHEDLVHDSSNSFAWKFFKRSNDNKAECICCDETVPFSGGRAAGLLKHLQLRHRELCPEDLAPKRNDLRDSAKRNKISSKSEEMRPEVMSSSPIWMIFKPDEDSQSSSICSLCTATITNSEDTTAPLVRHIQESHAPTFSRIKAQLKNPGLPELYDPANPLWLYFTIADEKSAACVNCRDIFSIEENGSSNLTKHLSFVHNESHDEYLHRCTQWRLQRKEEFCTYVHFLNF